MTRINFVQVLRERLKSLGTFPGMQNLKISDIYIFFLFYIQMTCHSELLHIFASEVLDSAKAMDSIVYRHKMKEDMFLNTRYISDS